MDYVLDRRNTTVRVFHDAILCKHSFIISDHFLRELQGNQALSDATILLSTIEKKSTHITVQEADKELAAELGGSFADSLHTALALRAGADAVLTENVKDFQNTKGVQVVTTAMLTNDNFI